MLVSYATFSSKNYYVEDAVSWFYDFLTILVSCNLSWLPFAPFFIILCYSMPMQADVLAFISLMTFKVFLSYFYQMVPIGIIISAIFLLIFYLGIHTILTLSTTVSRAFNLSHTYIILLSGDYNIRPSFTFALFFAILSWKQDLYQDFSW